MKLEFSLLLQAWVKDGRMGQEKGWACWFLVFLMLLKTCAIFLNCKLGSPSAVGFLVILVQQCFSCVTGGVIIEM